MRNIAIFASGEGTNAEAIMTHFLHSREVKVCVVVVNKNGIGAVARAAKFNVACKYLSKTEFDNGVALKLMQDYKVDYIILAGFLLKVPDSLLAAYDRHIINIHPSLLPRHGGKGMYGDRVHEAVIASGEKESGITIHFVNSVYDAGEIIFQAKCPVLPDDTPHTLAARIHQLEHRHFPVVIEQVVRYGHLLAEE